MEISQELAQRMADHIRAVVAKYAHVKDGSGNFNDELREVRAIAADLPAPVDPDLIEARQIVECSVRWSPQTDRDLLSGKNDATPEVKIALAAIKRGRELALAERGDAQ